MDRGKKGRERYMVYHLSGCLTHKKGKCQKSIHQNIENF